MIVFSRLLPFFSFVSSPPPLICEGLPVFPPLLLCLPLFLRREGRRAVFFFSLFFFCICQAGKRDVGRDCSAKSAAESGSCLWMSVSLSAWLYAPEDIFTWMVSGCLLSATTETKMLRCWCWCWCWCCCCRCCCCCCCRALSVILWLVSLTHLPEKHVVRSVSF